MNAFKTSRLFLFLFLSSIVIVGCDSSEPDEDEGAGELELITTVTVTLTPQGGGQSVTAVANDPEGDGIGFTIGGLDLIANTTYTGTIAFRDDINGEDITAEIEEEDDAHQIWYTPGGDAANRLTVTINDVDQNGLPVGLDFSLAVSMGAEATGTLNIVMSHYDEQPKDGVSLSDETDVDLTFPVNIASN